MHAYIYIEIDIDIYRYRYMILRLANSSMPGVPQAAYAARANAYIACIAHRTYSCSVGESPITCTERITHI